MSDNPFRLPRAVTPHRYTLALQPDLAAATFVGHVVIDATASEATDRIVLNAADLTIESIRVESEAADFELLDEQQQLVILRPADVGPLSIEISFAGVLNDLLRGWYRSTYVDGDGNEQVIATSQMQTVDCRRAFPCWDEPDFKAVFDVTLIVEPHLLAVSNGPEIERIEQPDGKVAVRFEPTMPMSTYLVAFVVGPLEATEPVMVPRPEGGEIPLRIIHVPGKGHLTGFGLEIGEFSLRWYQEYYGLPYPTTKCDMIALPDFAAGAMENLGCITYRESVLLVDPETATLMEQQTVADVVAHEIAHMWFGDLVTMRWWNGIWLNEAFATFMEIACCEAFRPEWQRWTAFSLERTIAFDTDSLESTRTVEFPVAAPHECEGMFDVLTYQKGGSLLRMLEMYLGEEDFRRGVSHYLSVHEYGNTETSDLWDAIEEVNPGTPVRELMDSWIFQAGYPLVRASLTGSTLVLGQERFSFEATDDPTLFVVPLHLRIDGEEHKVLMSGRELRVELPSADSTVVVNAGGHGFVRVNYDATMRARVLGELGSLTTLDRYNLVDDAWNEVVAGRLGAAELLDFLEGFAGERDQAVWQVIGIALRGIGRLVDGDAYTAFQARVAALVGPVVDELGWLPAAGESDLTAKLRGLLVGMLAVLGNDPGAQQRCRDIVNGRVAADPEVTAAATNAVAAVGTDEEYDLYLERFRTASTPQDQLRHLMALAEFPHEAQVRRTVDLAMSGEVKTQNAPFLLARCIANRWQGALAWDLVRRNWDEANRRFPKNSINRMVETVRLLTAPEVVADVQSFFSEHPIPQAAKQLDQTLERQRVNAALLAREGERLRSAWS